MGNKFLNATVFIVQLLIIALCATVAVKGFVVALGFQQELTFILSLVRLVFLLLFTASYYKNCMSEGSAENIFVAFFLFSSTLSEVHLFSNYENLSGISLISQVFISRVTIFAVLMMLLSLIGSGLFLQNNEHGVVSLFTWLSLACSIFLAFVLPIPLAFENLWNMTPSFWILIVLCVLAIITNIILFFFEPPGSGKIRIVSSLLFAISIILMWLLKLKYSTLISSLFFILGCILETVVLTRNFVRI